MTRARLTAPAEDYLKAIYELESIGAASTTDIAESLGIAAASVSGMMRRLAEQGLIDHAPYRGVRLTTAGRRAAVRTIRRHRVIEAYLATALGMTSDQVHDEAERLEHAASDDLVDRMAAAIGEPDTDPHGAPIPTRDGRVAEEPLASLTQRVRARQRTTERALPRAAVHAGGSGGTSPGGATRGNQPHADGSRRRDPGSRQAARR